MIAKIVRWLFLLAFVAWIGIQFIEVDRHNPQITGDIKVSEPIKSAFKAACYDCHSNETKWPWYSYVAPVSWLIEKDVKEGRKHLNFSEWEKYTEKRRTRKKEEIWEEINNGAMPLSNYLFMHPEASLTLTQKNLIKQWSTQKSIWE